MIAYILLAAAIPTAVDAELAFARDAQRIGMWTAFRKYADADAVMFTPQAVWAHNFLKDKKTGEVKVFRGAGHGFFCNDRPSYDASAAQTSWDTTLLWFSKYLN